MKYFFIFLLSISSIGYSQLTIDQAKDSLRKYQIGSYSYLEEFTGHAGYGAPVILTSDGGAAAFGGWADENGSCGLLLKLDKTGKEEWRRTVKYVSDDNADAEPQSIAQDKNGNYFVFMLMYDYAAEYRGGSERVLCYDKTGKLLWDIMLGKFTRLDNPIVSYIRVLDDGRIYLRGHIVTEEPKEDEDPAYHYWEGWLDIKGKLTGQFGDVIDWSNLEWQKRFKPE